MKYKLDIMKNLVTTTFLTFYIFTSFMVNAHQHEALEQAIVSDLRSAENKARDQYRHPKETLTFFGFKPTMTVVELTPGGGWYTEILAPALKGKGVLYAAHYPDTNEANYYSRSRKALEKKLASHTAFSEVIATDFIPRQKSDIAPAGSADLVLTFRNLHNWREEGVKQAFMDAYRALKKGGVLGVVEHRLPKNLNWQDHKQSGYMPQALIEQIAKSVGFTLAASSEINANPNDTAIHPKGVWTLPPVLRLGNEDRVKYLAIGESDRMTLKFVK